MKLRVFHSFLLLFFTLVSCSTDVDLYTDYQDIPVVYGLINVQADTNYVKITKAFCSNNEHPIDPFEAALVYDSSNYPGKLDVFIEELKSIQGQPFMPTGRKMILDTITIHNKKEGLFYSPDQLMYYTTERFNTNHGGDKYQYKISIVKPDYDTITAVTSVLAGDIYLSTARMNFQSTPTNKTSFLVFTSTEEGFLYEIAMQFNYREVRPGQPEVKKEISWSYGMKPLLAYEHIIDNSYKHFYSLNALFNVLERAIGNDTVLDANHPNVIRYIDDFYVSITAAGSDYYNYYQFVQAMQNSLSQTNEYSNINGGYGLFSSHVSVKHKVGLSAGAKFDLLRKQSWGFVD